MRTTYSGNDAWKSWTITGPSGRTRVHTRYSGDSAWTSWDAQFPSGSMSVSTRYSGSDAWRSWRVDDRAEDATAEEKAAALFVCLITSILQIQE
jgi:hypothetical protein